MKFLVVRSQDGVFGEEYGTAEELAARYEVSWRVKQDKVWEWAQSAKEGDVLWEDECVTVAVPGTVRREPCPRCGRSVATSQVNGQWSAGCVFDRLWVYYYCDACKKHFETQAEQVP